MPSILLLSCSSFGISATSCFSPSLLLLPKEFFAAETSSNSFIFGLNTGKVLNTDAVNWLCCVVLITPSFVFNVFPYVVLFATFNNTLQ